MQKLYLDIDGVILTSKNIRVADDAEQFLDYILENFDCYWLTTHCHDGNVDNLLKMLSIYFSKDIIQKISKIKPTIWDSLKTEAIDFDNNFFWIDDYVLEVEKKVLKQHNCTDNLLIINLNNKHELSHIINILKNNLMKNKD